MPITVSYPNTANSEFLFEQFPNGIEIGTYGSNGSSTGSLSVTGYFDPGYCSFMDCKLQVADTVATGPSDGTRLCARALLLETGDASSHPLPYGYGYYHRSAMVCLTDYDRSAMLSLCPERYDDYATPVVVLHAKNIWTDVYGKPYGAVPDEFALESDIIMCRELRKTHDNSLDSDGISVVPKLSMLGPAKAHEGLSVVHTLDVYGSVSITPKEPDVDIIRAHALTVVNSLTVGSNIATKVAHVTEELVAPNIRTTRPIVRSTPTGTADTLCRWAQIGSTHEMLTVGHLTEIALPGPSEQKLTNVYASSVLSLWYQADSSGNDIRLIGTSENAIAQQVGTNVNNTWKFNNVEIKEEYLGHNLRLLLLPSPPVPSSWTTAVTRSNESGSYIQGRYTQQTSDNDCALAASNTGNPMYKYILDAKFTVAQSASVVLTEEQISLLDWLAANKAALTNLLTSASSST